MTDAVIRLDRSSQKTKPFSECRGERQPDDPCYRVAWWQGQMVGKDMVLLPFDSQGCLVPPDNRTEPWQGKDADGKPVTHYPLYNQPMRDLLEKKQKRQAIVAAPPDVDEQESLESKAADVNLESWLRGEARYEWAAIQAAAKDRFSRVYTKKPELITDLVEDERLVPEDQLCPELAAMLPKKAAAQPSI